MYVQWLIVFVIHGPIAPLELGMKLFSPKMHG